MKEGEKEWMNWSKKHKEREIVMVRKQKSMEGKKENWRRGKSKDRERDERKKDKDKTEKTVLGKNYINKKKYRWTERKNK